MKIELAHVALKSVKITWPRYDPATEAQIVERLKTVPGCDGLGRCYLAPVIQVARLMELFPKASFDYEALRAADGTARAFYKMCVRFGIHLTIGDSGAVCTVGEKVSPLIQKLITDREHALRPLVLEAAEIPRDSIATPVCPSLPLASDEALGPLFRGIQNAAKKAEEDRFKYPKRRRRRATHDRA
jgi:hypothetical protein